MGFTAFESSRPVIEILFSSFCLSDNCMLSSRYLQSFKAIVKIISSKSIIITRFSLKVLSPFFSETAH